MPVITNRHSLNFVFALGILLTTFGMAGAQDAPPDAPLKKAEPQDAAPDEAPRVTGVGGLFFKADNPKEMVQWYERHLGITKSEVGSIGFTWRDRTQAEQVGFTAWGAFPKDTKYFDPSDKPWMYNYRVNDLDALMAKLEMDGVEIVGEIKRTDYGDFGWILDPEGTKIELWEPPDLIVPLDAKADAPQDSDPADAEVRAALEDYYDDFSGRDWDKFAANFHDGAVLATVWVMPGEEEPAVMMSTIPEFIEQAPQGPGSRPIFEERMTEVTIEMRGGLAQAWAHYDAKFGDENELMEWSGVDAFTLLKFEGTWKIVSIAYVSEDDS